LTVEQFDRLTQSDKIAYLSGLRRVELLNYCLMLQRWAEHIQRRDIIDITNSVLVWNGVVIMTEQDQSHETDQEHDPAAPSAEPSHGVAPAHTILEAESDGGNSASADNEESEALPDEATDEPEDADADEIEEANEEAPTE
jgi:hypothetical protein